MSFINYMILSILYFILNPGAYGIRSSKFFKEYFSKHLTILI